jgi:hypothetical protein
VIVYCSLCKGKEHEGDWRDPLTRALWAAEDLREAYLGDHQTDPLSIMNDITYWIEVAINDRGKRSDVYADQAN